jgi:hypothetical protein
MPLSVNKELRRIFELASLRREAGTLQTPKQWRDAARLQFRCNEARSREKDLYQAQYDTRVETARQRIIDKSGVPSRDHKPIWATEDRFSPAATLQQAQRDVRHNHSRRIERIDEYERQQLKKLVERSRRENAMSDEMRGEFERAADRRTVPDRRGVRSREH